MYVPSLLDLIGTLGLKIFNYNVVTSSWTTAVDSLLQTTTLWIFHYYHSFVYYVLSFALTSIHRFHCCLTYCLMDWNTMPRLQWITIGGGLTIRHLIRDTRMSRNEYIHIHQGVLHRRGRSIKPNNIGACKGSVDDMFQFVLPPNEWPEQGLHTENPIHKQISNKHYILFRRRRLWNLQTPVVNGFQPLQHNLSGPPHKDPTFKP